MIIRKAHAVTTEKNQAERLTELAAKGDSVAERNADGLEMPAPLPTSSQAA